MRYGSNWKGRFRAIVYRRMGRKRMMRMRPVISDGHPSRRR